MIRASLKLWFAAAATAAALSGVAATPAAAQAPTVAAAGANATYTADQLVAAGNNFFTQLSGNLAAFIERAISQFGLPNGYILGQTTGGAFIFGARVGNGTLYTQNAGTFPVHWTGPSVGFDIGGDFSQTMMLVYNLPTTEAIYDRFFGANGAAYVVGGVGMTVLRANDITLVPIVSGLGARVGFSIGWLNFTAAPRF